MKSVLLCAYCPHYYHGDRSGCPSCGCAKKESKTGCDQNMVVLEGRDLESFLKSLGARKNVYKLRISWYGDHVTLKINEGCWSPPVGTIQEPY